MWGQKILPCFFFLSNEYWDICRCSLFTVTVYSLEFWESYEIERFRCFAAWVHSHKLIKPANLIILRAILSNYMCWNYKYILFWKNIKFWTITYYISLSLLDYFVWPVWHYNDWLFNHSIPPPYSSSLGPDSGVYWWAPPHTPRGRHR